MAIFDFSQQAGMLRATNEGPIGVAPSADQIRLEHLLPCWAGFVRPYQAVVVELFTIVYK